MKAAAIILGSLAVLFAYLFFQKGAAVTAAEALVATNRIALTNAIQHFETVLISTNLTAGDIRSNLQYTLDTRTAHLNFFSNRLVQANLLMQSGQDEVRAAKAELQGLAASNAALAARQEELDRQLAAIPRLEAQLNAVRRQTAAVAIERDALAGDVQTLRLDYSELLRRQDDPAFLRAQAEKAEEAATLRRKAAARPISATDRRLPLELLADGSVRPVPPPKP